MKSILLIILALYLSSELRSQTLYRVNTIPVFHGAKKLKNPFTGGMNASYINQMDLNNDGKKDLVIQHNSPSYKISTFINEGNAEFKYSPRYETFFPKDLGSLFILRDMNDDGIEDLFFTSTIYSQFLKGTRDNDSNFHFDIWDTFKSISYRDTTIAQIIPFTQYQKTPVINDIDGDGDMDIVTTSYTGEHVYFKNFKKERNLPKSVNKFFTANTCFGQMDFLFNPLRFDTSVYCSKIKPGSPKPGPILTPRHDFFAELSELDVNRDGKMDFLAYYDNDNNSPLGLNIGTKDSAHLINSDTYFPSYNHPIKYWEPKSYWYDIDHDSNRDLLVSFSMERDQGSGVKLSDKFFNDDIKTISYYKNFGTKKQTTYNADSFAMMNDGFLADENIDAGTSSAPVFFNVDGDSLVDMLVPSYLKRDSFEIGKILYYKNVGTRSHPQYKLENSNFKGGNGTPNRVNIKLAVGDLNGDTIPDLLMSYFIRDTLTTNASPSTPIIYQLLKPIKGTYPYDYQDINLTINSDGKYGISNICLYDVNRDGLTDMILGDYKGLKYYQNKGTKTTPSFPSITIDTFIYQDNFNFYNPNSNHQFFPAVWHNLKDNKDYLYFTYYNEITGLIGKVELDTNKINQGKPLTVIDSNKSLYNLSINYHPTIFIGEITNDSTPEFAIGNYGGGVQIFSFANFDGTADYIHNRPWGLGINPTDQSSEVSIYPNPANQEINITLDNVNKNTSLNMLTIDGRSIYQQNLTQNNTQIDISQFKEGFYFIHIQDGKGWTYSQKFIKKEQ